MSQNTGKGNLWVIGLVIFYCISVIVHLGGLELGAEEPRRAIISLEMLQSGNYINSTQMGEVYTNKPVLYNWILCGFMKLTNSNAEWALRLPSLVFYLVCAFFHFKISRLYFSRRIALLSTFFTLTCLDIFFYGLNKGAEIDVFYSAVVYLQAISMFYYYEKKKWTLFFVASYFFCAIGFLTKGFPSIVFQGLTMAAVCVYAKSIRFVFKWQHFAGILVFCVLTGGYFYAYSFYGSPLRLLINLLNESIIHSAAGEQSNKIPGKIISYPALFLKLISPWALLLLLLFKKQYRGIAANPLVKFSLLFIAFNIWVYMVTGVPKSRYVYMFMPFACTVLVALYQKFEEGNPELLQKILGYLGWAFVIVAIGMMVLPFFFDLQWWQAFLIALLFGLLLNQYLKSNVQRIWLFITGIILTRLAYALLVIPIQHDNVFQYEKIAQNIAKVNSGQPIKFWSPQYKDELTISNKFFTWKPGSVYSHNYLFAQIPYYYFRSTGHVVNYDSVLRTGQAYVSFANEAIGLPSKILYTYYDPHQRDSFVVYKYLGTEAYRP